MKKAGIGILLFVFLYNIVGYIAVFAIAELNLKSELKHRIENGIEAKELVKLCLNKKEFASVDWIEEQEELRYNNELLDVISVTENENDITLYCLNDKEEKKLTIALFNHIVNQLLSNKSIKDNSAKKVAFDFNPIQLFYSEKQVQLLLPITPNAILFADNISYNGHIKAIDSPPPELI